VGWNEITLREGFFDIATFDAERDLGLARNVGRMFFLARKERRHCAGFLACRAGAI